MSAKIEGFEFENPVTRWVQGRHYAQPWTLFTEPQYRTAAGSKAARYAMSRLTMPYCARVRTLRSTRASRRAASRAARLPGMLSRMAGGVLKP